METPADCWESKRNIMKKLAPVLVLTSSILWGSMGIVTRYVASFGFTTAQTAAVRICSAAVVLVLLVLFHGQKEVQDPGRRREMASWHRDRKPLHQQPDLRGDGTAGATVGSGGAALYRSVFRYGAVGAFLPGEADLPQGLRIASVLCRLYPGGGPYRGSRPEVWEGRRS